MPVTRCNVRGEVGKSHACKVERCDKPNDQRWQCGPRCGVLDDAEGAGGEVVFGVIVAGAHQAMRSWTTLP